MCRLWVSPHMYMVPLGCMAGLGVEQKEVMPGARAGGQLFHIALLLGGAPSISKFELGLSGHNERIFVNIIR